jgi:arylsulfatase A-like enzyme
LCAVTSSNFNWKTYHINGKIDNYFPFDTTNITFPQLLQANGYQTAMFGKLHFGNNPKGFDEFQILPDQGNYYNPDIITKKKIIKTHGVCNRPHYRYCPKLA